MFPVWVQADSETIYPDTVGGFHPNEFRHENRCDATLHYQCVDDDSDADYVYDSTTTGGGGYESFKWKCTQTWSTIDSIKITARAKNSGLFGEGNSLIFGYFYSAGEFIAMNEICTKSTSTSFSEFTCVTTQDHNGDPYTQSKIEDDYEFGFKIGMNSQFYKYISSYKLTIYGTISAGGDKAKERRKRLLQESGRK